MGLVCRPMILERFMHNKEPWGLFDKGKKSHTVCQKPIFPIFHAFANFLVFTVFNHVFDHYYYLIIGALWKKNEKILFKKNLGRRKIANTSKK